MSDHATRREPPRPRAAPTVRDEPPVAVEDSGGLPRAVFTRFRPLRHLAAGGEAHLVMLVADRASGVERVAKVYPTTVRPDIRLLDALRTADERHVVRVIDWGEETDPYGRAMNWEVLRYVPLGSLAQLAQRSGGALPPERVRDVLTEVTAALSYLHSQVRHGTAVGVAHRDIKPENILVSAEDPLDLVLCDFGLVAELRATRRTTGRGGTPAYQAPETWWQKSQEPAQDWWSLGVVIVELLTGRNPNSGVGGEIANERTVFEHIATHGVDLDGVRDPSWLLLCRGLLTRAPEHRWGADEVHAWLRGETPPVHDAPASAPAPEPAAPVVAPFEVAGRLCRTPEDVGAAMAENWPAGIEVFTRRELQLDLSDWLSDNFRQLSLPKNLMRTTVTNREDAAARLVRFISWVAPATVPMFEQHPAGAQGIALLAQRAVAGDRAAAALVGRIDVGLLRAFARHRCPSHPACDGAQPGCIVLSEAADRLDQTLAVVSDRINDLATRIAAGGFQETWPPTNRVPRVDQALPVARALALRLLVDPDYAAQLPRELGRQREPGRVPWWSALREEATHGSGERKLAAAAVAVALVPVAAGASATEKARAAQERQQQRTERAARAGQVAVAGRGALRYLWRDLGNLFLAVVLAYLTTFAAIAVGTFESYSGNPSLAPQLLAQVSIVQTSIALPVLCVLGCLLIRPTAPQRGVRNARRFCWLFAIALGLVLRSDHPGIVQFPITLSTGVESTLTALNGNFAEFYPYAVVGGLILALAIGSWLVNRGFGTESGVNARPARVLRVAIVGLVVALYIVQPIFLWKHWSPPFLPPPTEVWWVL